MRDVLQHYESEGLKPCLSALSQSRLCRSCFAGSRQAGACCIDPGRTIRQAFDRHPGPLKAAKMIRALISGEDHER